MKELKFRGLDANNKWVFGFPYLDKPKHGDRLLSYIIEGGFVPAVSMPTTRFTEVKNESLTQYIGIKDHNDVEIYEGDILNVHQFLFDGNEVEKEMIGYVVYDEEAAAFCIKVTEDKNHFFLSYTGYETLEELPPFEICSLVGLHEESFEVTGNIHTPKN